MNRRDFLKMIGVATAAAVITPARTVTAVPELKVPEMLVTDYALTGTSAGYGMIAAFVLPAPASIFCRARILLPADGATEVALVQGAASYNGPGQVILNAVQATNGISVTVRQPVDVSVFSREFVSVEWPAIQRNRVTLEIDYTAFDAYDEEFFLGLYYSGHGRPLGDCPPFTNRDTTDA